RSLGMSYDWSREIDTTDPAYVKWTQWIFLKLFERGLAYQAKIPVNWCPELGTVLANEEIVDGKSERGGHPVERVPLRQWMLRITEYADRLDADLASLDWPDSKGKQHHWIGRSEGAEIDFPVDGDGGLHGARVRVFTTRPDTLPGVTYVVLAPEHALVNELLAFAPQETAAAVRAYVTMASRKSDLDRAEAKEKTGVPLGVSVTNPINGETVPLWVGDYVIATYGTGAVMAVPAHDERDHAFALGHGLPIAQVIAPASPGAKVDVSRAAFTDDGITKYGRELAGVADGTPSAEARKRIIAWLTGESKGQSKVTYRLRDWVFSRQRYWGEPIPIYFPVTCDGDPRVPGAAFTIHHDEPLAVPVEELPLNLPDLDDFGPGDDPAGPLARVADWRFFQRDGRWFARETNTMPQWAGSCWYYLRFTDPKNGGAFASPEALRYWGMPDLYVGGAEHAVPLGEPFTKLFHQGIILGEDGEKMSKSRGNVVNPDTIIASHGTDTLRLYLMFLGPLEAMKPWNPRGIEGVHRFLQKVWRDCIGDDGRANPRIAVDGQDPAELQKLLHETIRKVGEDIEALRFNTAISQMMIFENALHKEATVGRATVLAFIQILAPFAPHFAEELWSRLGAPGLASEATWPTVDPEKISAAE